MSEKSIELINLMNNIKIMRKNSLQKLIDGEQVRQQDNY